MEASNRSDGFISAALAIIPVVIIGLSLTFLSVHVLDDYLAGLFILTPLYVGVATSLIHGRKVMRTARECRNVSFMAIVMLSAVMLAVAMEGIICLVMAAPIAFALAWIGSLIGYAWLQKIHADKKPGGFSGRLSAITLAVPLFMISESAVLFAPELVAVTTSVEIDAPVETVWKNVVAFPRLQEPEELLFKAGISYPIEARIEGTGKGAIRYCMFNTGAFVEPIEVWDENKLLKFSVREQPVPMRELSPYGELDAPHLHDYFVSKEGQFKLTQLPNGKILLEGTTWYYHRIRPEFYWQLWSNHIIHSIHRRVLDHIREVSEKEKLSERRD